MKLEIPTFPDGGPIAEEHCLIVPAPETRFVMGPNRSPPLRWSGVPEGTRSFAILMVDSDAPTVPELVNREGRTIPVDQPRAEFVHWVLVDVDGALRELAAGADSDGVTPHGKPTGRASSGVRGRNDYTGWFADDPEMRGTYGGYDGPAPPWNDERVHRYHFRLHALDVPSLELQGEFGIEEVRRAMEGHVLAEAEYTGTYTVNPELVSRREG